MSVDVLICMYHTSSLPSSFYCLINFFFKLISYGDCLEATSTRECNNPEDDYCFIYASSSSNLFSCDNKPADFYYFKYRCVPGRFNSLKISS